MSVRISFLGVFAVLLLFAVSTADVRAQGYYATGYVPYSAGGYGGYHGGYHSGTVAEGILRGRAELFQAYGLASLYYTQALRQREEARSLYIDNQLAVRAHYAEQRELENQRRQEVRTLRRQRTLRLAEERKAQQTAAIEWPAELLGERYAKTRHEIEALARLHAGLDPNADEATSAAVRHAVRELARQVIEEEESSRLAGEQSKIVRQFVRGLTARILRDSPSPRPTTEALAMNGSRQR